MFSRTFLNYIKGCRTINMIYLNCFCGRENFANFKRKKKSKTFLNYIKASRTLIMIYLNCFCSTENFGEFKRKKKEI